MSAYDEFKGKVRLILNGGERVLIACSHSVGEMDNSIPDLKIGDIVACNSFRTLRKFDENQKTQLLLNQSYNVFCAPKFYLQHLYHLAEVHCR